MHVHQRDGMGTCHGGIIEGIADYCRLKLGFAALSWPHTPTPGGSWENGYQTCGFFLDWIEVIKKKENFVSDLNSLLENQLWDKKVFNTLAGCDIDELWNEYQAYLLAIRISNAFNQNHKIGNI